MQLAVITDEISQDLDHALEVMAEYGIFGAEIRGVWGVNISDADEIVIKNVINTVNAHRVKIVGIATPVFKCDLPGVVSEDVPGSTGLMHGAQSYSFDQQMDLFRRSVNVAKALDVNLIRVFTFWKKGQLTPEVEASIVEAFQEPAHLAENEGMTIIVENEHACFTGTGVDTAQLIRKIDSPAVRSVWDPGNAVMAGEAAFPVGYNAIKEFVQHVHVKDVSTTKEWCVVGEGIIDWPGQLSALKNSGYSGYLSLETHYSGGGDPETSSRQCLVGLKRLFNNI